MQMPQTIRIRNGQKVRPTFSGQEYANRQARLRAHLAEAGIDAAVFTSYHNINYYSDFLYCSFGRPYALVVTQDAVVSISANIDGGQPWRRTQGTDNIVYTDWQRDNYFAAIQQALPKARRIGVEFDHLNLQNRDKLAARYPDAELVDVAAACMHMRMIKSAEEHAIIRHGAQVADIGGAAVVEALHDQVPEYEVALHATQAMVREIAKRFPDGELMDTWTWFQSGINTDGAHNPVTSRKVNKGDILSLNCFPMIAGYYTALERTLFLDDCSDEHLRLWEVNVKVHEAGLKLIRPGARCCDIARELNEIYLEHDLLQYRTFGYGHSFGTLSHYYGREAGLELREDIDTVLEPGMVVSMEPMIMLPEGLPGAGGYREHDILIVTEQGAENITRFPYGPQRNIIRK
ncbi:M24 family metallopeptidase [Pseudomonas citronellolis]|uniref:M24 family metallopeptidase n=1 Tax=Pseudomonas citronellolis TaxID=53408 RepID=A0AAW6PAU9_9PSED|nr:M24 family metallopeptidase [Pseudomonas citronellolis]MDF3844277.1 M24 family metallopeptidase [Pseudomonas citronellolis]